MKKGMSGHQSATAITNEWLSPPEIIKSCGEFDLDPSAPIIRPWDMAKQHYTVIDNGLKQNWHGRVWFNPPYDRYTIEQWMKKMAEHNNGIALLFARTETEVFQNYVFDRAASILFLKSRLTFYTVDGKPGEHNGGAPSCLIAYGKQNVEALGDSGIVGKHLLVNYTPVIVVGINRSWKTVISITLTKLNGEGELQTIYSLVERIAPEKVRGNNNYRAKVRQILQYHFTRISKGKYTSNTSEEQI